MKISSKVWCPSPGGSTRFWNLPERQSSSISSRCQSDGFQHLSIISRSVFHIFLSPLTHSMSLPRPDFKWVVSCLAQIPKHQSLVAIWLDFLTFVLVSQENMNIFCLLYL